MEFYRVVDYDNPGGLIIVRDFIDYTKKGVGIIVTQDGTYKGNPGNGFDVNIFDPKSQDVIVFTENSKDYFIDDFDYNLESWWEEPYNALQIDLEEIDDLMLGPLLENKYKIFSNIFMKRVKNK